MVPKNIGRVKASQIRNSPNYPVQVLHSCAQYPEKFTFWALNNLGLTEGIMCRSSGWISYAPEMVSRMDIKTIRTWFHIDGFESDTKYSLRLIYVDAENHAHEQYSAELRVDDIDTFMFEIPLEHVDKNGWFTCALHFKLLSPLEDIGEIATAHADGIKERPCKPILIRGAHLEIKG